MKISNMVHIQAKSESIGAMEQALIDLEKATQQEPECIFFSFYQSLSNAEHFILLECFASHAALERHMQLPHTVDFFRLNLVARVVVSEISETNLPKRPFAPA
jgi:quinol monooxygenase YgiN